LKNLYIKNETTNPTGAFMDRGTSVEVTKAIEFGASSLCCGTTGNLGVSIAAYAAKMGLPCRIFLPPRVDLGKLYQMIAYGADVRLSRTYEDALVDAEREGRRSFLVASDSPAFLEGEKTTCFEICEQLGWKAPDRIIVPMGNGGHLSMIWKALKELRSIGLVGEGDVKLTGVQAAGCKPIFDAFWGKKEEEMPGEIHTLATDIALRKPLLLDLALKALRESGGTAIAVSDEEILEATSLLARTEGIFAEPSASATIAGLKRLVGGGRVDRDEVIVCIITGMGLKDPLTARRFVEEARNMERLLGRLEERRLSRVGRTKLLILEILSQGEGYGYSVWRDLRDRYGVHLRIPCIYQHLAELARMGLINKVRSERVRNKPERRYYLTSERGMNLLRSMGGESSLEGEDL
jgi:threonine synthase